MTDSAAHAPTRPARLTPARGIAALAMVVLLIAMATSTTWYPAGRELPGEAAAFDADTWAENNYTSTILPTIQEDAVDLATLLPAIAADPEAAGEQYGHRDGTSPYTYAVSFTGTAGTAANGLLPVEVAGLPGQTRVSVQIGPAINGTALRDATGQVSFNDFTNQVDYAAAATALNDITKREVLAAVDPAALAGQQITVVGAAAPLNPELITVTAVSLEAAP